MSAGLLIIGEDDEKLGKLYADFFTASDFIVFGAKDGTEVLKLVNKGIVPRVLILDIMMPNMDGIETCRRARDILGPGVPIVFLTTTDRLDQVQECVEAGGDDYIIKSERLDKILARIKHWATSSSRAQAQDRRLEARQGVAKAVNENEGGGVMNLSSASDKIVRQMSVFIARARNRAGEEFGTTDEEKCYLLGYVTGVADHWSNNNLSMKPRFMEYLRAVLCETETLSRDDVQHMMDSFDDLALEDTFRTAWARGQKECGEADAKGAGYVATGLADFKDAGAV